MHFNSQFTPKQVFVSAKNALSYIRLISTEKESELTSLGSVELLTGSENKAAYLHVCKFESYNHLFPLFF